MRDLLPLLAMLAMILGALVTVLLTLAGIDNAGGTMLMLAGLGALAVSKW